MNWDSEEQTLELKKTAEEKKRVESNSVGVMQEEKGVKSPQKYNTIFCCNYIRMDE